MSEIKTYLYKICISVNISFNLTCGILVVNYVNSSPNPVFFIFIGNRQNNAPAALWSEDYYRLIHHNGIGLWFNLGCSLVLVHLESYTYLIINYILTLI